MSRSTQYIGMTKQADEFVKTLKEALSDRFTVGMFDDEIPLRKWVDKDGTVFYEVVQMAPWSSGPMIFTALVKDLPVSSVPHMLHQWIVDEKVSNEVDYENGKCYV